jgi:hypothetical protein
MMRHDIGSVTKKVHPEQRVVRRAESTRMELRIRRVSVRRPALSRLTREHA